MLLIHSWAQALCLLCIMCILLWCLMYIILVFDIRFWLLCRIIRSKFCLLNKVLSLLGKMPASVYRRIWSMQCLWFLERGRNEYNAGFQAQQVLLESCLLRDVIMINNAGQVVKFACCLHRPYHHIVHKTPLHVQRYPR